MLEISSSISINFGTTNVLTDIMVRDFDEQKYITLLDQLMQPTPRLRKYELLKFSNRDDTFSLFNDSGYWIICYSERGESRFIAIFREISSATNYFASLMTKGAIHKVDLSSVFQPK